MKKAIIVLAIACMALCSCAKGGRCECKQQIFTNGELTSTIEKAPIFPKEDQTCSEAAEVLSTKVLGVETKYSNCKAVGQD